MKSKVGQCSINWEYKRCDSSNLPYPLVFIHGLAADLTMWQPQIDYFSMCYTTLAMTLPGHGNSDAYKKSEAYTIQNYAEVVLALLDELAIDKVVIIGNSMGGVIGYHIRMLYPDRIAMLITHGTTPRLSHSKRMIKMIQWADRAMISLLGVKNMMKMLSKQVTKDKEAQRMIFKSMSHANSQMIPAMHEALSQYDYLDTFKINVPIVIIKGQYDRGINKLIDKDMAKCAFNESCSVHMLNGAGHILNLEVPQIYNKIVESEIEKLEKKKTQDDLEKKN